MGLSSTSPPWPMASRARSGKNTSQLMTTPTGPTGGGRSRTGSPVPVAASRAGSESGASGSIRLRNGTNSPKGTRRSFSTSSTITPSASKATATLRNSSSSPSITPATRTASSSRASAASSSPSCDSTTGPSTSTTSSGQRTRSTGPSTSSDAARCRSNTSRSSVSIALVPWGPPPCTAATSMNRPVGSPSGATAARPTATSTTAAAAAPATQARRIDAASATATATVTPPTSSDPPTRATPASELSTWPTARVDSGTPPKGHRPFTASNRIHAPGSASHRPIDGGVAASAPPSRAARMSEAKIHPGRVRSCIHQFVGASRATPASQPRRNRDRARAPGDRQVDERQADERQGPEADRRQRGADQQAAGDGRRPRHPGVGDGGRHELTVPAAAPSAARRITAMVPPGGAPTPVAPGGCRRGCRSHGRRRRRGRRRGGARRRRPRRRRPGRGDRARTGGTRRSTG